MQNDMEHLLRLLGSAFLDTRTVFGVKVLVGGLLGVFAGLLARAVGGMFLHGVGISACGITLMALSLRSLSRGEPPTEAVTVDPPPGREAEARLSESQLAR